MATRKQIIQLGKRTLSFFEYMGGLACLCLETLRWVIGSSLKQERTLQQVKKTGLDSLFLVSLVAFFTGMVLALQTAYLMQKLSSEIYIASIIALSMTRELGPVLTALIVAGRCGAAITAEIGTMNVTEQVDALRTLATNPVRFLVVPRFVSLAFVLPILTIYADLVGIFGGFVLGVGRLSITPGMYLSTTFQTLQNKDIATGLIKTFFFGMIIALVACFEGFKVSGGAEGVGKATTASVVKSFILIIIADCFFTALFYFFF